MRKHEYSGSEIKCSLEYSSELLGDCRTTYMWTNMKISDANNPQTKPKNIRV